MRFSIYQESKKGGRKSNQDRMGYCFTRDALLMVLADGMGGHIQGDIAAQIALQTLAANFQRDAQPDIKSPPDFLAAGFLDAHRQIHRYCAERQLPDSPRTTLVACVIQQGEAYCAHAGDSRLYWLRDGSVIARTRDHSKIEVLVSQGLVSPLRKGTHPDRNKLFNCLGSPGDPRVELSRKMTLKPGDTLFLCSDGLWSVMAEQNIASAFKGNTVMRAVPDLIQQALLEAGSESDNVTGLALTWEGTGHAEDTVEGISTVTMPVGTMTTTIQATQLLEDGEAAPLETLTDDEIEKAIDEIRDTIRKSSKILPKV